jgi:hypothetical protein
MKKKSKSLSVFEAEKLTKQAAKKRQIVIELNDEQAAAFTGQYGKLNPAEAAELVFLVKKKPTSKLKIAGYSYHGDTCCA